MAENNNKIGDNEVQVGQKTIGPNTVVQVNLKTLLIVLGILGSAIGYVWKDISGKVENSNTNSKTQIESIKDEIKEIKNQDLKTISIQLNQVDGKVQGIFMNMQRNDFNPTNQPTTRVNNIHIPTDTVRPNNPNIP